MRGLCRELRVAVSFGLIPAVCLIGRLDSRGRLRAAKTASIKHAFIWSMVLG